MKKNPLRPPRKNRQRQRRRQIGDDSGTKATSTSYRSNSQQYPNSQGVRAKTNPFSQMLLKPAADCCRYRSNNAMVHSET